MKGKVGAPSKFTAALAAEICERVSEGEPLRQICREKKIAWRTIYNWRKDNEEFDRAMTLARDIGMDAIFEDTIEIADTPQVGVKKKYEAGVVVEATEEDMLGHRKLRIETRFKLLSKWNPTKYGDRITHTGDPAAPVALVLNGSDVNG